MCTRCARLLWPSREVIRNRFEHVRGSEKAVRTGYRVTTNISLGSLVLEQRFGRSCGYGGLGWRGDRSVDLPCGRDPKAGIAFFWALANNAASSGEASSAKDCGGWTAHGSRSRVDGDPDGG